MRPAGQEVSRVFSQGLAAYSAKRIEAIRPEESIAALGLFGPVKNDGFVKSPKMSHCERSEAISYFKLIDFMRLLRLCAPRNDATSDFLRDHQESVV
jgi:hypothetical protein